MLLASIPAVEPRLPVTSSTFRNLQLTNSKYVHLADNGSRQSTTIRLSGQYGVIHLLRMLVQFGKILSFTPFVEPEGLMKQAQDLLLFLHTRHLEYHVEKLDYVDATEEYLQNVPDAREKKLRILGAKK